jgi:hypothetical protein
MLVLLLLEHLLQILVNHLPKVLRLLPLLVQVLDELLELVQVLRNLD